MITDSDGTYPNKPIPELVALATQADTAVGASIPSKVAGHDSDLNPSSRLGPPAIDPPL